ncbi:MAG TPA: hypothetical protein PKE52_06915, partial [Bacteroidales bacterium]|nr:hypothetical protein [Bacteroidales bacterium]
MRVYTFLVFNMEKERRRSEERLERWLTSSYYSFSQLEFWCSFGLIFVINQPILEKQAYNFNLKTKCMELFDQLLDLFLNLDQYLFDLTAKYQNWIYLILFLIIFLETGVVV